MLVLLVGGCAAWALVGEWPALWAALGVLCLVQIGFVLSGRNPWWMQAAWERRDDRSATR